MVDKFKKSSNERIIKWINNAVLILKARGYNIRFHASTN